MGSGLSTIPGPPPYGRSSTVRCGSVVCARGSSVPTLNKPRSSARPTMPNFSAPLIISGNSVTTSTCTASAHGLRPNCLRGSRKRDPEHVAARKAAPNRSITACGDHLLQIQWPIHEDQPGVHLDLAQILPGGEHPVLPSGSILHHHHRARRRVNKLHDMTHIHTFQVAYRQSNQVSAKVFALPERRHVSSLYLDHAARQSRRGIAILYPIQPRDQPVAMRVPFGQPTRYTLACAAA